LVLERLPLLIRSNEVWLYPVNKICLTYHISLNSHELLHSGGQLLRRCHTVNSKISTYLKRYTESG
jgi:hypothetical protein